MVGARLAAIAALSDEAAAPLASACTEGTVAQRVGCAEVYAATVGRAPQRAFCEERLIRLFDDPSEAVRRAAAGCWAQERVDVAELSALAERFIASAAFLDDTAAVMHALERSTGDCSALVVQAAQRFLEGSGPRAGDLRDAAAVTSHLLRSLIVRACAQAPAGSVTRAAALDAIDLMFQLGVRDLDGPVASADR